MRKNAADKIVTVERKGIDEQRLYGVVVGQSDALMLLHEEDDFQFDGYSVIRRKDVSRCYSSESNAYGVKLMKEEGRWEPVPRRIKNLPLDTWSSLLKRFVGKVIILDDESADDFYIGPVLEVRATGVVLRHFDGCGAWIGNKRVPFSRVTRLQLEDRYSTTHAKYLKNSP